jgi:hypothetical protein
MPTVLSSRSTSESLQSNANAVKSGNCAPSRARSTDGDRFVQKLKSVYQVHQQVKFLHLQAEADYLLQQLQTLKQQKQQLPQSNSGSALSE